MYSQGYNLELPWISQVVIYRKVATNIFLCIYGVCVLLDEMKSSFGEESRYFHPN